MSWTPRAKLTVVCAAVALLFPLAGTGEGSYFDQSMRLAVVGMLVIAVAPRIEAARKKRRPEAQRRRPASAARTHTVPVLLRLDAGEAFDRALDAVRSVRRVTVSVEDRDRGEIQATVGASLRSVGEHLSVMISPTPDGLMRVEITGRPKLAIGTDTEKSNENIDVVVKALRGATEGR